MGDETKERKQRNDGNLYHVDTANGKLQGHREKLVLSTHRLNYITFEKAVKYIKNIIEIGVKFRSISFFDNLCSKPNHELFSKRHYITKKKMKLRIFNIIFNKIFLFNIFKFVIFYNKNKTK